MSTKLTDPKNIWLALNTREQRREWKKHKTYYRREKPHTHFDRYQESWDLFFRVHTLNIHICICEWVYTCVNILLCVCVYVCKWSPENGWQIFKTTIITWKRRNKKNTTHTNKKWKKQRAGERKREKVMFT